MSIVLHDQKQSTLVPNVSTQRFPKVLFQVSAFFLLYMQEQLADGMIYKHVMQAYVDDTTLQLHRDRMSVTTSVNTEYSEQLRDALIKDLQTISEWGHKWFVAYNSSKTLSVRRSRLKKMVTLSVFRCPIELSKQISRGLYRIKILGPTKMLFERRQILLKKQSLTHIQTGTPKTHL